MQPESSQQRLKIKKYSNRRFYDTTRSRHLTLADMHQLICDGHELSVVDSKTGEDITNVVLTQIILEKDPPKLEIFPANILHQVIRTQNQFLGSVVEEFFRQVLETHKASQDRWTAFLRNTIGMATRVPSIFDWTRSWMDAMSPRAPGSQPDAPESAGRPPSPENGRESDVAALRDQIESLTRRVEKLSKQGRGR
jgi:polyhydroxyalkanoate synthesis repressor PhaR